MRMMLLNRLLTMTITIATMVVGVGILPRATVLVLDYCVNVIIYTAVLPTKRFCSCMQASAAVQEAHEVIPKSSAVGNGDSEQLLVRFCIGVLGIVVNQP